MDEKTKAQKSIRCQAEKAGRNPSSLAVDRDVPQPSLLCRLSYKDEFPQSPTQQQQEEESLWDVPMCLLLS